VVVTEVVLPNGFADHFDPCHAQCWSLTPHRQGRKRSFLLLLLLLLLVALAGCSRELDTAGLPGVYRYEGDGVKQEITVSANGKYRNVLYLEDRLMWSDEEDWEYEQVSGKFGITFSKFRFGIPGHRPLSGYWFVEPERSSSGVKRLCFDPDLNRCFEAR
jgi:hypothetical protein